MSDIDLDESDRLARWFIAEGHEVTAYTRMLALTARVREQEQEIAVQRDRAACWRAYAEHLRWCRQCAEGPQCHDGDALRDTALGAEGTRG